MCGLCVHLSVCVHACARACCCYLPLSLPTLFLIHSFLWIGSQAGQAGWDWIRGVSWFLPLSVLESHVRGSHMRAGEPNSSKPSCLYSKHCTKPSPRLSSDFKNIFSWLLKSINNRVNLHANSNGNCAGLAQACLCKSALSSSERSYRNQIYSILLLINLFTAQPIPLFIYFHTSDKNIPLFLSGSLCHVFLLFSIKRLHYLIPPPSSNHSFPTYSFLLLLLQCSLLRVGLCSSGVELSIPSWPLQQSPCLWLMALRLCGMHTTMPLV